MKKLFLLLLFALVGLIVSAQYTFAKQWDKRFGGDSVDAICAIFQDDDGYLLMGSSNSGISGDKTQPIWGGNDYWIVKTNFSGTKIWDKRFGGQGGDFLTSPVLHDSIYVLGGSSGSYANGDKTEPTRGAMDFWLFAIDKYGNKQWDKRFGSTKDDLLYTMQKTYDSGFILGGISNSPIGGDKTESNRDSTYFTDDYWIVKVDSLGLKQWDKTFGGQKQDGLASICIVNDGGYLLGGSSCSGANGDKSQDNWDTLGQKLDYWLIKIDSLGNKQWDRRYGTEEEEFLKEIVKLPNGNFLLTGTSEGGTSGDKTMAKKGYWLVTIDPSGNIVNQWAYNGNAVMSKTIATRDGGFLIGGYYPGDGFLGEDKTELNLGPSQTWVLKLDSNGQKLWDKTLFTLGYDVGGVPLQTDDNCYVIGNGSNSNVGGYKTEPKWGTNGFDYWILKFCMEPFNSIEPGTGEKDTRQIQVWPNPFSSDISIALTGSHTSNTTFTITSLTGQIVYQQQEQSLATGYTKMLDLSYLPTGVYFVEVSTADGKYIQRVVKQ